MKLIQKLYILMKNRYGIDELYKFLLITFLILSIINLFLNNNILHLMEVLIIVLALYRVFSKNIQQRRKENNTYLKIKRKIFNYFHTLKSSHEKKKYNVYRKCPKCKTILKLPLPTKRGIKKITCPKCKKKIKTLVLKKQKIEIISKKGGKKK